MRTYSDIVKMAAQDYSIGLTAHYKPLADLISARGYKDIIEVGTAYGGNAFYLLSNAKIESLICIDPYTYYHAMPGFQGQEEYDILRDYATQRLTNAANGNSIVLQMFYLTSKDAIEFKQLGPADLIFLDGSHEYEDVLWECENYSKLINPGGVLSGHDYNIFEGVNKAVDEFCLKTMKQLNLLPGNIWYLNY